MWKKVLDYIRANRLLSPGDRVVVGVSGGADSVCLLAVLARLAGMNAALPAGNAGGSAASVCSGGSVVAPRNGGSAASGCSGGSVVASRNGGSAALVCSGGSAAVSGNTGCAAAGFPGLALRAVHVHHGLRGAEADRDEAFVQQLCAGLGVPLVCVRRKVAEYASEHGLSTEEAGRVLRYEALEQEAERWQAEAENGQADGSQAGGDGASMPYDSGTKTWIAVAHHQDDNAETILHHLLRGSGLKGLSGMRPKQGNRIRPLLCVNRQEIQQYLRQEGLDWCEDSTNEELDYTRNRIRREILPLMTQAVNVRAVDNILHAGELFAQADRYLEQQAERVWEQGGSVADEWSGGAAGVLGQGGSVRPQCAGIRLSVFVAQPPILRSYLIRHMLDLAAPGWRDITSRHFQMIDNLAERQVGSRCDLPCGMQAVRDYDWLVIRRRPQAAEAKRAAGSAAAVPAGAGTPAALRAGAGSPAAVPAGAETPAALPAGAGSPAAVPAGGGTPAALFAGGGAQETAQPVCAEAALPLPDTAPITLGDLTLRAFSRKKQLEIPKNQYTKWFDYDKIKGMLSLRYRRTGDYLSLPGGGSKTIARYMIDAKFPRELRDQIPLLAEEHHVLWVVGYRISEYYKITNTTKTILQVECNGGEEYGR